jgi:hypothetical protein
MSGVKCRTILVDSKELDGNCSTVMSPLIDIGEAPVVAGKAGSSDVHIRDKERLRQLVALARDIDQEPHSFAPALVLCVVV